MKEKTLTCPACKNRFVTSDGRIRMCSEKCSRERARQLARDNYGEEQRTYGREYHRRPYVVKKAREYYKKHKARILRQQRKYLARPEVRERVREKVRLYGIEYRARKRREKGARR